MQENTVSRPTTTIWDYIAFIWKWRKFIVKFCSLIVVAACVVVMVLPQMYLAHSTVVSAQRGNAFSGLMGGLGKLPFGLDAASLGFGVSGNRDIDTYMTIFTSRKLRLSLIERFDLITVYKLHKRKRLFIEDVLKRLDKNIGAFVTNEGAIVISAKDRSPQRAARMVEFLVGQIDSINTCVARDLAGKRRLFIEERLLANIDTLQYTEDSLVAFQKRTGIVAAEEQAEVSVRTVAELEGTVVAVQFARSVAAKRLASGHPELKEYDTRLVAMRQELEKLRLNKPGTVLLAVSDIPDDILAFVRLKRDVTVQDAINRVLIKEYEMSKIEEKNTVPSFAVIDPVVVPQKRYSPKRRVIVMIVGVSAFMLSMCLSIAFDALLALRLDTHPKMRYVKVAQTIIGRLV